MDKLIITIFLQIVLIWIWYHIGKDTENKRWENAKNFTFNKFHEPVLYLEYTDEKIKLKVLNNDRVDVITPQSKLTNK